MQPEEGSLLDRIVGRGIDRGKIEEDRKNQKCHSYHRLICSGGNTCFAKRALSTRLEGATDLFAI